MIKKSRKKIKYLEDKKTFQGEMKNIFHRFYKTYFPMLFIAIGSKLIRKVMIYFNVRGVVHAPKLSF